MRILHIVPSFHPAWAYGGMPRCAYELCRSLVGLDEQVTVWTTDALDENGRVTQSTATPDGVAVRYFRNLSNRLAYHGQLYLPLGLAPHAMREIGNFDLVHLHSHRHLLEILGSCGARRAGVPYVFTGNGTVPAIERRVGLKRILDQLLFKAPLRHAAACIAVSEIELEHYRGAGVERERICVIPNGIRPVDYEHLPAPGRLRRRFGLEDDPLVLFVGKITPRKGVDILVRALARLPPRVHLAVAGNFMMPAASIHRLVAEHDLAGRVHFTGMLAGEDKLAAYVDADVVAYPSTDEIFGLVPAEGFMCGTPAVVCDDSGCGKYVGEAGGGLVVPYGDPAALAAALLTLLDDPELRRRCAANGKRYAERHLDWDGIAEQTRELYRTVVAGETRRGPAAE